MTRHSFSLSRNGQVPFRPGKAAVTAPNVNGVVTEAKTQWNRKTLDVHASSRICHRGTLNSDAFMKATETCHGKASQRQGQKGRNYRIRNRTGKHEPHCAISPGAISSPSLGPASPGEDRGRAGFSLNAQGRDFGQMR